MVDLTGIVATNGGDSDGDGGGVISPSNGVGGSGDSGPLAPDSDAFQGSFQLLPHGRYFLSNRTPFLIRIQHSDPQYGELVIPPLAERVIKGDRLQPFAELLRPYRQRHEVLVRRYVETISPLTDKWIWVAWVSVLLIAGTMAYDVFRFGTLFRPEFAIAVSVGLVVVIGLLVFAALRERRRKRQVAEDGTDAGDIAFGLGGSYADGNETARGAHQLLTLVIVLTVGALLPTVGILVATDAGDFLIMEGGLRVKPGLESRMVARIIQIIYTCVLSLFPALLFFQFDRLQAGSIRNSWVRALFRMDGRMHTLADVDATYGHAMYEASNNSADSVRGLGGKNSPIVIATILIALGWTVLVIRTESYDFSGSTSASQLVQVAEEQAAVAEEAAEVARDATSEDVAIAAAEDAEDAAASAASAQSATDAIAETSAQAESAPTTSIDEPPPPETLTEARDAAAAASSQAAQAAQAAEATETGIQATSYFQILAPNPSAAGMAFLGAYFFGIYLVLRSYFRGDLRTKLYNQITARLVTVVVVAYLINAILFSSADQQKLVWALAFLAGVVPTTVLDRVMHAMGGMVKSVAGDTFATNRPLEHIDGIDIYDASRLEAEGIPDVAALASSDLATVMLQTRLPIGRIVDWADQAALMVVVGMPGSELDPRVQCLRTRGIRTGTDLLAVGENDENIDEIIGCLKIPSSGRRTGWLQERHADVETSVATPDGQDGEPSGPDRSTDDERAEVLAAVAGKEVNVSELCQAIRRQPVMAQILQWRSSALDDPDRSWIPLPDQHIAPPVSESYVGPLPAPARS